MRHASLVTAGKFARPLPKTESKQLRSVLKGIGLQVPVRKNCEIYGENQPAECLYVVIEGVVRCYRILADGRRQINAFYFPGDIFGFETGSIHALSAEAIVDSRVLLIKRSALAEIAAQDTSVACNLWAVAATELQRAQDHAMALIMNAQERVIGFLLEIARRETSDCEIDLPMSRGDIADYLGLTIETVSRTLKQLERSAAIALPTFRHVVLRNCHGRLQKASNALGVRACQPVPMPRSNLAAN